MFTASIKSIWDGDNSYEPRVCETLAEALEWAIWMWELPKE